MAAPFDRQSLGMRVRDHARWVGLVMLAGLVPLGLGAVVLIRESDRAARAQQDARLTTTASSEAAALAQSLGRARALLRLSAASPVWRDAVAASGSLQATIAADGPPIRRVHAALAGLRAGYGLRLAGVADAIDSGGREFASVQRGGALPITLLSGGEKDAPFFGPSMSLPVGAVYQTKPYISPDMHQWVISSSTTAAVGTYDRVVIQLEVPIESLRREALQQGRGSDVSVIDARTGLVVFDSAHRQGIGAALEPPDLHGVRRVTRTGRRFGLTDVGGRRIAFRRLPPAGANANDWYVVVNEPHPPGLRPTGAAQFVLALMVLGLGGLGLALGRQSAAVRREAERTAHQAMHDELTGLPNRLLFRDRTERAIAAARRDGVETAVLLMDVDGFREINDTLGHHAGDRVIAAVAARLRGVLRSSDTLARLGGDEFAILMPRVMEESAAAQLAGRIRTALAAPLVLHGVPLDIRASTGIAV